MLQVKRALYVQLGGLMLAIVFAAWLAENFPLLDYVLRVQRRIGEMRFWGAVLYPLLYGLCNVLLLPAGVLAIGSGLMFGLWWGTLINIIGNVCGAAVAFFISRKLGRGWVQQKFLKHPKWALLDEAIGRDGWKIIFLSQVHPLFPTSLLNYLYGVTRIRFSTCMLWIAVAQAPGLFLYAYLGTLAQLGLRLWQGNSHPLPHEYFVWFGGLGVTLVVTAVLARLALRLLAEAEEAAKSAPIKPPQAEQVSHTGT